MWDFVNKGASAKTGGATGSSGGERTKGSGAREAAAPHGLDDMLDELDGAPTRSQGRPVVSGEARRGQFPEAPGVPGTRPSGPEREQAAGVRGARPPRAAFVAGPDPVQRAAGAGG